MLEKAMSDKNPPSAFYRQNSRQGMMFRSHQVSLGKWHFKSFIIALLVLLVFIFYVQLAEEHTGVQSQKRSLVVRPAKPYKSPSSRRRHSKTHKDGKGIQPPVQAIRNISLSPNKQAVDFKHDKALPVQQPTITANRAAPNNALQFRDKFKNAHKGRVVPSSPPLSQVSPVKNQHIGIFKVSNVKEGNKPLPNISQDGGNIVPNIKPSPQPSYNMHGPKDGVVRQSTTRPPVLRYVKNNNGIFPVLKPLPDEGHADVRNKPAIAGHHKNDVLPRPAVIPKPVIKMRGSLAE